MLYIASLKNEAGVSVTSMKGKPEALSNSDFEDDWREVVEKKVSIYGSLSEMQADKT